MRIDYDYLITWLLFVCHLFFVMCYLLFFFFSPFRHKVVIKVFLFRRFRRFSENKLNRQPTCIWLVICSLSTSFSMLYKKVNEELIHFCRHFVVFVLSEKKNIIILCPSTLRLEHLITCIQEHQSHFKYAWSCGCF